MQCTHPHWWFTCNGHFAADGFVVQTGDPEGPAEGFIDPSTEKPRTIPLEIMVNGEKAPFYGSTLEVSFQLLSFSKLLAVDGFFLHWSIYCAILMLTFVIDQELGLYKAQTRLPFNAFGTMAMAREVRILSQKIVFIWIKNLFWYLLCFSMMTGVREQLCFKPDILAVEREWTNSKQCQHTRWTLCRLWLCDWKRGLFGRSQSWRHYRVNSSSIRVG